MLKTDSEKRQFALRKLEASSSNRESDTSTRRHQARTGQAKPDVARKWLSEIKAKPLTPDRLNNYLSVIANDTDPRSFSHSIDQLKSYFPMRLTIANQIDPLDSSSHDASSLMEPASIAFPVIDLVFDHALVKSKALLCMPLSIWEQVQPEIRTADHAVIERIKQVRYDAILLNHRTKFWSQQLLNRGSVERTIAAIQAIYRELEQSVETLLDQSLGYAESNKLRGWLNKVPVHSMGVWQQVLLNFNHEIIRLYSGYFANKRLSEEQGELVKRQLQLLCHRFEGRVQTKYQAWKWLEEVGDRVQQIDCLKASVAGFVGLPIVQMEPDSASAIPTSEDGPPSPHRYSHHHHHRHHHRRSKHQEIKGNEETALVPALGPDPLDQRTHSETFAQDDLAASNTDMERAITELQASTTWQWNLDKTFDENAEAIISKCQILTRGLRRLYQQQSIHRPKTNLTESTATALAVLKDSLGRIVTVFHRDAARRLHPDHNKDYAVEATQAFQSLQEEKDTFFKQLALGACSDDGDLDELFQELFGQMADLQRGVAEVMKGFDAMRQDCQSMSTKLESNQDLLDAVAKSQAETAERLAQMLAEQDARAEARRIEAERAKEQQLLEQYRCMRGRPSSAEVDLQLQTTASDSATAPPSGVSVSQYGFFKGNLSPRSNGHVSSEKHPV